jgi:hypothetical protein
LKKDRACTPRREGQSINEWPSHPQLPYNFHSSEPSIMSGFEVIGLVLAIIPIFEAASGPTARGIEHTKTAFSASRAGSKLEDFYINFHYELTLLQMAIGKLVSELGGGLLEEEKVLLKEGSPKLWNDPRVIPAVEDRLGVGFETFELHISKLLEQLDKLVTKDETVKLSVLQGKPVSSILASWSN